MKFSYEDITGTATEIGFRLLWRRELSLSSPVFGEVSEETVSAVFAAFIAALDGHCRPYNKEAQESAFNALDDAFNKLADLFGKWQPFRAAALLELEDEAAEEEAINALFDRFDRDTDAQEAANNI